MRGTGDLLVEDYRGEDISKVAGTLNSITIEVEQPKSVLNTLDYLPVKDQGTVKIKVLDGAGFEYIDI